MTVSAADNHYPWNDAHRAAQLDPIAYVLHCGMNAICEHLSEIAALLAAPHPEDGGERG
jgi:hypothetical protein